MRLRFIARLRSRIRSAHYLRKWVVLGALIGAISGLGAAAFFLLLDVFTRLMLGLIAGYMPASPVGEGGQPISDPLRWWAIPPLVALGGLAAGIIVFRLAPEAEGHGTDAAIGAFHHGARRIRARIPGVKMVASAITIGAGGSGGREGPTAQIGAGFGSWLARTLDLDARDARIAVACGMGAGIGAIFRAPLGGAVLAAEIPYRDDVEAEALVPGFVASIVAFSVFGAINGFVPIFGNVAGATFSDARQLPYYALIGVAAGLVGRLYIRGFYALSHWFSTWKLPREVRPAIAGFAVGCIGVLMPGALGTGYGWIQASLDRNSLLALPLLAIVALPLVKILATSLSIGSGGSGGVFGPGMVIGGMLGASAWRILEPVAPAIPVDPAGFVIVGMMALFGSIAHAPLAVMLMVAEMTGSLSMLAPAMLAIGLATLLVGDRSIYKSQLLSRSESPAHRFRFAMPLMASIPAAHAARMPRLVLTASETVGSARGRLEASRLPGAPVVDTTHLLKGSVTVAELRGVDGRRRLDELPLNGPIVVTEDGLDEALSVLSEAHRSWAPVTANDRLVGVVSVGDIIATYRGALAANVNHIRSVGKDGSLVEAELAATSALVGKSVAAIGWPRDAVLVSIGRSGAVIVPRGDTVLDKGDLLTVFVTATGGPLLERILASTAIGEQGGAG